MFEAQDCGKTAVTYELDLQFGFGLPRVIQNQICGCARVCTHRDTDTFTDTGTDTDTDTDTHTHTCTHAIPQPDLRVRAHRHRHRHRYAC